jgi:hypothetical protein
MKVTIFIIGVVVMVVGFALTGWTWYDAAENGRISEGCAYAGPVLIVLGALRMLRASVAGRLPIFVTIPVVGVAIGLGFGNSALVKAAFPQATPEVTTSSR